MRSKDPSCVLGFAVQLPSTDSSRNPGCRKATAMDYNTPEKCARPPKMAETLHPCGEVEPFSLRGVLSTPKSPDLSPAEVLLKPLNAHASEFFPSQPTADAESWPRWWNWGAYEVWVLGFPALGLKVQEPGGGGGRWPEPCTPPDSRSPSLPP